MIAAGEATVVGPGIVALPAVGAPFEPSYTGDDGDRAGLLRDGAVVGVEQPGLRSEVPRIEAVHPIAPQTRTRRHAGVDASS